MAHFRDTYKPVRFFFLDVRAGVIIVASLLYVRAITISLDILVIILAYYLERIGMTFTSALRALRAQAAGRIRYAQRPEKMRRTVDFQRELMAWESVQDKTPVEMKELKLTELEKLMRL